MINMFIYLFLYEVNISLKHKKMVSAPVPVLHPLSHSPFQEYHLPTVLSLSIPNFMCNYTKNIDEFYPYQIFNINKFHLVSSHI